MNWVTLFLSPNGRIAPRPFWIGIGILALLHLLRAAIALELAPLPMQVASLIGWLALYPGICVLAKRLHDAGRSAFLIFVPAVLIIVVSVAVSFMVVMPLMMEIFTAAAANPDMPPPDASAYGPGTPVYEAGRQAARITVPAGLAIHVLFALWTGLGRSDPEANRFGPAAGGEAAAFA